MSNGWKRSTRPLGRICSPAKARTIERYLGDRFQVVASYGHIRDLPANANEVPAAYKGESWARLGVDVDNDFKPLYVVNRARKDQVKKLKSLLKDADELYLATDEDREGESIAWHLSEVLNPKVPVKRMVFHEITAAAIRQAVEQPRHLDRRLVDAQETRRILDRLFGYEVSPVLWKLIRPKLSAGRVQSPAIRIVVERERERMEFRPAEYWDLEGTFAVEAGRFEATLVEVDGNRVATGKDFDQRGGLAREAAVVLDRAQTEALAADLGDTEFEIRRVERKPYRRSPYPPFRTSTLQQEAGRKLRFTAARTMQVAQRLYENGYITYMRTDSTALSESAVAAARSQVAELFGAKFLPDGPRVYADRVKSAQEAHEAIRPAGEAFRTPEEVTRQVDRDEARLYELIWKRTVASQMESAVLDQVTVDIASADKTVQLRATGSVVKFNGFLTLYDEGHDDNGKEDEEGNPNKLASSSASHPKRLTRSRVRPRLALASGAGLADSS